MKKILTWLDLHLEEALIATLLVLITLSTGLQVVMRYALNNSLTWPEELSRFCFVAIGFMSIGYCIRRDNEIKLDLITSALPKAMQTALDILVRVIELAVFGFLFFGMQNVVRDAATIGQTAPALRFPLKYLYGFCLLGIGLGIFRAMEMIAIDIYRLAKKKQAAE